MATGVIRNLSDFKLPPPFQHPYFFPALTQDVDFQDSSEEDDELLDEDEMEDLSYAEEQENIRSTGNVSSHDVSTGESPTEMTEQLLKFSELISNDIQRYFGQKTKEEDPDSCNIYEDYFTPRMFGGQELYYQDLVKMAQSKDHDGEDFLHPLTPPVEIDHRILKSICTKEDPKKLGPLTELFDFGLRKYTRQKMVTGKDARLHRLDRKYAHIVPMHRRMLPLSFWKEPSPVPSCILNTNTPDFSDLLENWTSDTHHELQSAGRDLMSEFGR
ncbi:protein PERCC1 isoform 1-T2 [Anomaloglossus baeobatrachus]|uniref:protein PERCC1 n=1 Tax=Anomaloglossus baeobatrachus TaxID=238106 RepID=UPI003F4FF129